MNNHSTLDQAIQSQLRIMEHFLQDLASNVNDAQYHIACEERNVAIGALINCRESFEHLRTFYDAILVMHRNADIIEREIGDRS